VPVLHRNYSFKNPMYKAFPTASDPADRAVGPLSPLPCQAWHGYGVSSAHNEEVRGCRRACERTPSGVAAAAPPAGAAVGQPYPRFPIALEQVSSLGEWPRRGGRHVHDRRKSNRGVYLRRVTSGVVVRALGPTIALLTTAIANATKNPRCASAT
jgi:hypothetical protein